MHLALRCWLILLTIGLAMGSFPLFADDAPTLAVKPTDDFEVTGDGSNAAWKQTEWTPLQRRPGSTHEYETRIKVLYSKTGLYTLFDGTDAQLTASIKEDYGTLWKEDVYELFLWPDEKQTIYFEYEISPFGYELPILVPNIDGKFLGWRPWLYDGARLTRKAASIIDGNAETGAANKGWRAEVFIPYDLLRPLANTAPEKGTKWRANFYRMDYDNGTTSSWDWARVGEGFHEFQKFGTLVFE
jgi:hypothetical protein